MSKISHFNLSDLSLPDFQAHKDISLDDIQEIADSIKKIGVIEPLIIKKTEKGWEIVAGCIRYHAAKLAGLKAVPCIVMSLSPKDSEILKLHENVKRIPLDHIDQGHTFIMMMKTFEMTEKDIAECSGKSESYVSQHISLVRLGKELTKAVKDGLITFSQARELMRVDDPVVRQQFLMECQNSGATVSTIKKAVDEHLLSLGIYPIHNSSKQVNSHLPEPHQILYKCEACLNPIEISKIRHVLFCPDCRKSILDAISDERHRLSSETPEKDSQDVPG